jgi:hypothetical protein
MQVCNILLIFLEVLITFRTSVLERVIYRYRVDESDPWGKGKEAFQQVIRRGEYNK